MVDYVQVEFVCCVDVVECGGVIVVQLVVGVWCVQWVVCVVGVVQWQYEVWVDVVGVGGVDEQQLVLQLGLLVGLLYFGFVVQVVQCVFVGYVVVCVYIVVSLIDVDLVGVEFLGFFFVFEDVFVFDWSYFQFGQQVIGDCFVGVVFQIGQDLDGYLSGGIVCYEVLVLLGFL